MSNVSGAVSVKLKDVKFNYTSQSEPQDGSRYISMDMVQLVLTDGRGMEKVSSFF